MNDNKKIVSIIITHFGSTAERYETCLKSLESLFATIKDHPCEVIFVDNGGPHGSSQELVEYCVRGLIHTYIRNSGNRHFGFARNQALRLCHGDYICIADNDIEYKEGWLRSCLDVLEAYPEEKIYAAPLYNVAHHLPKYWTGRELDVEGKKYRLNTRAGSNCFVIRRPDFEEIGMFSVHRVAGTKWTEKAKLLGYTAAVTPEIMVKDLCFRQGYNFKEVLPVRIVLSDQSEIYFNQDEYRKDNSGSNYSQQSPLNTTNCGWNQGLV